MGMPWFKMSNILAVIWAYDLKPPKENERRVSSPPPPPSPTPKYTVDTRVAWMFSGGWKGVHSRVGYPRDQSPGHMFDYW